METLVKIAQQVPALALLCFLTVKWIQSSNHNREAATEAQMQFTSLLAEIEKNHNKIQNDTIRVIEQIKNVVEQNTARLMENTEAMREVLKGLAVNQSHHS